LGLCANRGMNDIDRLSIYHSGVVPYLMKSQYSPSSCMCVYDSMGLCGVFGEGGGGGGASSSSLLV
jgi:hypothetical protein